MNCGSLKLNVGSGRIKKGGFINIDRTQIIDGNGSETVDIIRDVEKQGLPFCDNSCDEIVANNVLEHLNDLRTVMNEMWRCLKSTGTLSGIVPAAGTDEALRDPTHVRVFVKSTFGYLCGKSEVIKDRPKHPKYADYGYLPWECVQLEQKESLIYFTLRPLK